MCTSEANASALSRETFSEIAGVPALLIPLRYQCRPSGMRLTMTATAERAPLHAHPRWSHSPIETRYRACHDTLTVHTTGDQPPRRTDVADNPLTVGLTECARCGGDLLQIATGRFREAAESTATIVPQGAIEKLLSANLGGTLFYSPSDARSSARHLRQRNQVKHPQPK